MDVMTFSHGCDKASAQQVSSVCERITFTPSAFIKVDLPDAFAPVMIALPVIRKSLLTGSSISGWYSPFARIGSVSAPFI